MSVTQAADEPTAALNDVSNADIVEAETFRSVSLSYVLSSLAEFNAIGDSITYNDTTCSGSKPGTTVSVTDSVESVGIDDSYLNDSDDTESTLNRE